MLLVRESGLHERCKAVIVDSISLLKKLSRDHTLPFLIDKEYILENGTLNTTKTQIMPDTTKFLFIHFKEIENSPSYIALLDYMESSPQVKKFFEGKITDKDGKVVKDPRIRHWLGSEFTMQFLSHYFDRNPISKFNSKRFERTYSRLEDHIYGELDHVYFAPLMLFSGSLDCYQINDKLKIRRIKPEDFSSIFSDSIDVPAVPYGAKYALKYVAEYSFRKNERDAVHMFDFLIKSLRLFKTGSVSVSTVLQKRLPNFGMMPTKVVMPNSRLVFFGEPFELTKEDMRRFKKFFSHLESHGELLTRDVATSVRRFNSAIEHLNEDDKIIDFMISLEAMYSADYKQEMTFRISSRVANLLAVDDDNAHFLYEFVKQAYDRRSTLVHGGQFEDIKVDNKVFNAHDSARELERITRMSIRKFLNLYMHYRTKDKINKALNNMIVTKAGKRDIRKNAKGIFD